VLRPVGDEAEAPQAAARTPARDRGPVSYFTRLAGSDSDAAASLAVRDVNAAYLLQVEVTGSDLYKRYALGPGRGATGRSNVAARTGGRRVGLRLSLLRLPDRAAVWVASGTGDMWNTRIAGPAEAANLDDDLRGGGFVLYPPPPEPQTVSANLMRRLLADLPSPPELEPN
jgi:hypothetical protein